MAQEKITHFPIIQKQSGKFISYSSSLIDYSFSLFLKPKFQRVCYFFPSIYPFPQYNSQIFQKMDDHESEQIIEIEESTVLTWLPKCKILPARTNQCNNHRNLKGVLYWSCHRILSFFKFLIHWQLLIWHMILLHFQGYLDNLYLGSILLTVT